MLDLIKPADILSECQCEKTYFLKLLKKLVLIETPPVHPKSHRKLFIVLEKELNVLDYSATWYPGIKSGGQLFARPLVKSGNGCQLLLGHIDTVWPMGTLQIMPFVKNENILSGPGIYDMKAGIAMMITALKIMNKLGVKPAVLPVLFINSDEETGTVESKENIIRLAKVMNRVYVLEPSLDPDGKLKTRRKGVGHYDIKIKGVSSHAGI
ncbi:MAG: M20/M25/M40 family metallo-hydrolase, partial [Balneolaceae bacterium]